MNELKKKFRYYGNYIFVKRNFLYLLTISVISYYWFNHYSELEGDSARVRIFLSLITFGFCGILFTYSFITSFLPYIFFLFKKRILETDDLEREDIIKVNFKEINPTAGLVEVEIRMAGVRRPLFGFTKIRLIFDDLSQSGDLLLDRFLKQGPQKTGLLARKAIWLPNIKDYRIIASFVHFEDFFHLFSLPYRETERLGVFTEPQQSRGDMIEISTEKSEEPVLKVFQHKRAKGELLDYKKYAPGDDIRRIIWKNYARVRELTVRIPDRNFPYVSHINVLASFYDGSPSGESLELKAFILDIYKEKLRQIVDSILEQNFTVQFISDQSIADHYQLDDYQRMLYMISASAWQKETPLETFIKKNYYHLQKASNLLVFSSLCPHVDLQHFRNGRFTELNFCYYDVASTISKTPRPSPLKRVFLVNPYEPLEAARRKLNARSTLQYIFRNGGSIKELFTKSKPSVIEI